MRNPVKEHKSVTHELARSLDWKEVYFWLLDFGYFPESYVVPPCFQVINRPNRPKKYTSIQRTRKGTQFRPPRTEYIKIHFPKTELTDRTFGVIHPEIHNDIAYHITKNWKTIVDTIFHKDSMVVSYSFPIPIDSRKPGRLGFLRAGRMIYEFIGMIDDDIASITYQYTHLVKADIKNFYPSIYTHSIPWAIHGKKKIRKPQNMQNYDLVGNRLDKLFQNANDGCTNGVPIGPVVSDLIGEMVATGADRIFTKKIDELGVKCEAIRFKDDYRILVKSESDGKAVIKALQAALKEFNLELSGDKTNITLLPDGLFREWVSKYHSIQPRKKAKYSWKEFRELYLSVLQIDKECPSTGVIDRFLADITTKDGRLKIVLYPWNIQKVISMLLMLGNLRVKAFPKIIAILEAVLKTNFGALHKDEILSHLESYLDKLSDEEERNKYLISWISYFIVSNGFEKDITFRPKYKDAVTRSIFNNRGAIFKNCTDFKVFLGCKSAGKKVSMTRHLDVFNPSENI